MSESTNPESKYGLLQKLLGDYEYLGLVAQTIEEQLRLVEAAQTEMLTTIGSVRELVEKGKNRETFVPLGSGVMVPMSVHSPEKMLVLLGENVYAKLSVDKVEEYLSARVKLLGERTNELVRDYSTTLQRIQLLQPKINRLAQELQVGG
jgi:prefoldin alpha subunit